MVLTMTAKELKNRTGDAFRAVARGDRVILTRRGEPVAIMNPFQENWELEDLPPFEEAWGDLERALAATEPRFATASEAISRSRRRS